jgi:creatinine amidohydrolase
MIDLLVDVCCSAVKSGFKKVALVSGHGHHDGICKVAARQVFDEVGVGIVFTQPHAFAKDIIAKVRKSAPGGMCHACEYETSLLMHYGYPVDLSKATKDDIIRFKSDFVANDGFGGSKGGSVFWSTWGLQVSKSGAYGDPTVATKETGAALMEGIVSEFCRFLEEFYAWQGPVMPPN